jgi:hypothetical protein
MAEIEELVDKKEELTLVENPKKMEWLWKRSSHSPFQPYGSPSRETVEPVGSNQSQVMSAGLQGLYTRIQHGNGIGLSSFLNMFTCRKKLFSSRSSSFSH